jgi:hypothetical protein
VVDTAIHWVPLTAPEDVWETWRGIDQAARLRVLVDAYGLGDSDRSLLVDLAVTGAQGSWLRMRAAAEQRGGGWARMWDEGVGDVIRRREEWLVSSRRTLNEVLLRDR